MITDKSKYFITDNLILASVLKSKGFEIVNINKENPRHSFFEFLQTNELTEAIRNYWSRSLLLEPISFAISMKELKTILYDHSYEVNTDQPNPEERRSNENYASGKS